MADAHSRPAPTCLCSASMFSRRASASCLCSTYAQKPAPRLLAAARAPGAASTRRGSGAPPRAAAPLPRSRGWRRTRPWRSPGRLAASPSRAPGAARGATATREGARRRRRRGRRRRRPPWRRSAPRMMRIFQTSDSEQSARQCVRCCSIRRQRRSSDTSRYSRMPGYK